MYWMVICIESRSMYFLATHTEKNGDDIDGVYEMQIMKIIKRINMRFQQKKEKVVKYPKDKK